MEQNTGTKKTIRFIDSSYRLLFTIPDGGNVRIIKPDGLSKTLECKYVDDYHTMVGNNLFHICEFAERMENNGSQYLPAEPMTLPDMCYSVLPSSG